MLSWLYRRLRPLFFLLEPERAHGLVMGGLNVWSRLAPRPKRAGPWLDAQSAARLRQTLFGLSFTTPVGLAAGLDKGSVIAPACFRLGFGSVEIGSITPRPQSGNERPRMFRLPAARALINRMGFNNDGLEAVARRLRSLPAQPGPIGINLGKNKDTPNERAADDYLAGFRALAPYAGYIAINVSSPNTPGLRALQGAAELSALISAVSAERDRYAAQPAGRRVPLLVKLSPDEPDDRLEAIAQAAVAAGADGLIATNTTLSRAGVEPLANAQEAGGLSGEPLRARALSVCARLYRATGGATPIIGVGGIASADDAYARIRAGASLVQLYTGLVYGGPDIAARIARGLAARLERDGFASLRDAVGRDSASIQ